MSLRARIKGLHAARCSDLEIAEFLGCPHWYVRQCLNRCDAQGRYRRPVKLRLAA